MAFLASPGKSNAIPVGMRHRLPMSTSHVNCHVTSVHIAMRDGE